MRALRPSLGEAHGGYTSCAVASLFLLRPFSSAPSPLDTGEVDIPLLIRWTASMQGSGIDGGGFRGRTNKLVDGCYSWWVGGLNPLLAELVRDKAHGPGGEWEDWEDTLLNKEALQRYILTAAQITTGGLRDKPGKPADAYHTSYNLAGLATAQHRMAPSPDVRKRADAVWKDTNPFGLELSGEDTPETRASRRQAYLASYEWTEDEPASVYVGGEDTRINAAHPLYNLTATSLRRMMGHFYGQELVNISPHTPE